MKDKKIGMISAAAVAGVAVAVAVLPTGAAAIVWLAGLAACAIVCAF